ncbi:heat shock 70 kDa protein 16 isoform X3 [Diospyros lotus]|uniref:heat shock 70 kDa protein 16 isoform X3 n=1 Tax=Diospyros lotus TaxID=55363 RepID=UPI002250EBBA|nr:heat shock 70 kDa protein 16 isoform X3 [Diospyros lotus]
MSVLGFDIGNENCVIAVVKQRGIDVLLNDESKRETPAVVSFGEKQRFLGAAGDASATMNPKSTISQVKRLIGRKFMEPGVQDDIRLFPFQTSEGPDGGILIHLQYLGETHTFTPIQILAMLLAHLKQITDKNLEISISDCVIGIPSYFTDLQRRAYLHAAEIAGLKPLRLMHDCTATALGYGIYKTDFPNGGPIHVMFVDIGHCDTQVAVASLEPGRMKILSHAFDSNLGGRDFDDVLFRYFAAEFKERYKIDVYSNARASIRLRASCEKLKKVLSANAEAPLNIECLMEEKDVRGFIKREDFEKLSSHLLERISIPCCKALADSGLTREKVHTVELVGSGSRIPAIARILASLFGREPGRTINASECVARGCALQCAMLSPTFRVREYEIGPFQISHPDKVKIKVRVQLNLHGIVAIDSASLIEDHWDDSRNSASVTSEKMETDNHGSYVTASSAEDTRFAHSNTVPTSAFQLQVADELEKGKTKRRLDLPVSENVYGGMTKDELLQAQQREFQLAQQDLKIEQTKDKKNTLESYVYETRNKLLNTYRSFASDPEKEGISSNLQQTEEWLYEDGDDETENAYTKKLEDLKKLVDPIENRFKDEEARAQATRNLLNCIVEYRMAAGSLPASEKDAVLNECSKAEHWLREKTQLQDSLPKNTDPILWSSEIKKRTDALQAMCKHITRSKVSAQRMEDAMESDHRDKPDDMRED